MKWRRWIQPGFLISLLLAIVALTVRVGPVSEDIRTRVENSLRVNGVDWATVETRWQSVTVTGIAPGEVAQQRAVAIAAATPGVRNAVDGSSLLPLETPYTWVATRAGDRIVLAGFAPSEAGRAGQLATARRFFPEAEIINELALARGAADVYAPTTSFALGLLTLFAEGQIALSDRTLTVVGTAASSSGHADVGRRLTDSLPAGVSLGKTDVLPARAPRFVWSAAIREGAVHVAGFVPNETMRELVADETRQAFPALGLVDETVVASGQPPDFLDAVVFALQALGRLDDGGVTLDGRTLDVAGEAASVEAYEDLLVMIRSGREQGLTIVSDVLPATVDDYRLSASLVDGTVLLEGYVPSQEDRATLESLITALGPARGVDDRVRVARGAPAIDWMGAVKFALTELSRLETGEAEISREGVFTLRGVAGSSDGYAAIARAAETLPAGLRDRIVEVAPPAAADAYAIAAERDGDSVVLTGFVDTLERFDEIEGRAGRYFGPGNVVNRLTYASGAPDGFFANVRPAFAALSRMTGGRVAITVDSLVLEGFVAHAATGESVVSALETDVGETAELVVSVDVRQRGQPISPQECNARLAAAVSSRPLEFTDAGAAVLPESIGIMDTIAAALVRCPDALVEIGVHSDSSGARADNRERTQLRADALRDLLISAGIDRDRVAPVGYGEDEPIADNDTEEGRARNRRIAFALSLADPVEPFIVPEPVPEPDRPPDRTEDAPDPTPDPAGEDAAPGGQENGDPG